MQRTLYFTRQLRSRASSSISSSTSSISFLLPLQSMPWLSHLVIYRRRGSTTSSPFAVEDNPESDDLNNSISREPPLIS